MRKILIADDEKNMRWILSKNLKEEGFDIIEAADGEEAFNLFMDKEPDMILLDYKMPVIDGMEVLKRIRTINDSIPVIMITAHGSTDAAVEAMKLGAADYLSKPFDMEELKLIIKRVLKIEQLCNEIDNLREQVAEKFDNRIIGNSRSMKDIFEVIERVAATPATVLIT
jgi:two-component system, NtrC family, response regulator AtoC